MSVATQRSPLLRVVDPSGTPLETYPLAVSSGAPAANGFTLSTIDAWEEEEVIGPWKNFQWSQVSFPLGYRLHAMLRFTQVESDVASNVYGLTLLHRLWKIGLEYQITYAALQFAMFASSAPRPVVINGNEWRPSLMAGKQGLYELDIPIVTRDLVTSPGEWARSQW